MLHYPLKIELRLCQEVREGTKDALWHYNPFVEYLAGRACAVRFDPPPEASVASGVSNPHDEAYTASPTALLLSLESLFIVGVFSFQLLGTTLTFRNGLKS